jgi:hypothetical protein
MHNIEFDNKINTHSKLTGTPEWVNSYSLLLMIFKSDEVLLAVEGKKSQIEKKKNNKKDQKRGTTRSRMVSSSFLL